MRKRAWNGGDLPSYPRGGHLHVKKRMRSRSNLCMSSLPRRFQSRVSVFGTRGHRNLRRIIRKFSALRKSGIIPPESSDQTAAGEAARLHKALRPEGAQQPPQDQAGGKRQEPA